MTLSDTHRHEEHSTSKTTQQLDISLHVMQTEKSYHNNCNFW